MSKPQRIVNITELALRYGGKAYHLCINGRTGLVQGERPYSVWKILAAVVVTLVVAGVIAYIMAGAGYTPSY